MLSISLCHGLTLELKGLFIDVVAADNNPILRHAKVSAAAATDLPVFT